MGDSFPWSSLTALGLPHNAIGPSGAVALARDAFPRLKVLRELLLYSNNIGVTPLQFKYKFVLFYGPVKSKKAGLS